ncbi:HD-GYP domain-containing protein [Halobacillus fulvus]|nr:HD-GYP domain-containing protein [Halobacillus fulvus]
MRVHPSQLVTGCLITEDVMGKTSRPIVAKHTVVHPIHIEVLQKFMVGSVNVAGKLSDGSPFIPDERIEEETEKKVEASGPFHDQYMEAVQSYKKWFEDWRGGMPVDIHAIRQTMVPLLERVIESKWEVFLLHHFSSSKDYIYHHSVAMGLITGYLAYKMDEDYGTWIQAGLAGMLSDSGMSRINPRLLEKETTLREAEFEEVKKHPTYSYRMVEHVPSLSPGAKLAVLQHHERLDGSGYPLGLPKDKLHPFSQIIAVSDMYHAMTSERMYRKKQSPFKVLEEIEKEQFGRHDHQIVQVFIKEMTDYGPGTGVLLSDGRKGNIVFVDSNQPIRPMVRMEEDEEILALSEHLDLYIEEVLN